VQKLLVPSEKLEQQLLSVFSAWGMDDEVARITTQLVVETDLRGVDSHGIAMLPAYDAYVAAGEINVRPQYKIIREAPSIVLIDADGSLGHSVSAYAMNLAIDKCLQSGVAVASVFNSHHFGAAGCYSQMAADRGVIGLVTSGTKGAHMVPTFGGEPVMGTNPLAFAAPASRHSPFSLDMATTTAAAGRIKVHQLNHKNLPPGWVVNEHGESLTDISAAAEYVYHRKDGGITPLGGSRDQGSHKGYGLAVMVHILGATLSGASFTPLRGPDEPHNLGHFFLAIDPQHFRSGDAFGDDLDKVIDTLHDSRRAKPEQPVLVAGDPEQATRAHRLSEGIPIPDDLMVQLRAVVDRVQVPFLLAP
jgi:LDH2 family malate/lactate/ureidoglycolate dehydrogenase